MSENGLASKLNGIRSSGWIEVRCKTDELSRDGGTARGQYTVGFSTERKGFTPAELVCMDFYGFVQKALVMAGVNGTSWRKGEGGRLELIVKRGNRLVKIAAVAENGNNQGGVETGMRSVSVIPVAGRVGQYAVAALIRSWGDQLKEYNTNQPTRLPGAKDL